MQLQMNLQRYLVGEKKTPTLLIYQLFILIRNFSLISLQMKANVLNHLLLDALKILFFYFLSFLINPKNILIAVLHWQSFYRYYIYFIVIFFLFFQYCAYIHAKLLYIYIKISSKFSVNFRFDSFHHVAREYFQKMRSRSYIITINNIEAGSIWDTRQTYNNMLAKRREREALRSIFYYVSKMITRVKNLRINIYV